MVATVRLSELQVADWVMSASGPVLKWPIAVNCCWSLTKMDALLGLTVMEMRARTVRVVVPSIVPDLARMIVAPAPTPVANPEALIVATDVKSDIHMTELVRFRVVVPSL